ncbi:MAG: metallophosphoesterase family protein [Nitrosotalea sp.]
MAKSKQRTPKTHKTFKPRTFGQKSKSGLNSIQKPQGNQKFYPLPPPTGQVPYHMSLDSVLPPNQISKIQKFKKMVFHIVGDTGGIKDPYPQQAVAVAMKSDFDSENAPMFFYHLGDVVYFYGEASQYFSQFYEPYANYPGPIFAIPGNHDGDVARGYNTPSLEAFVTNFCSQKPQVSPDGGESSRDTMTQPNVFWTLDAPLVTMIGLYSNVPEGGEFEQDQIDWFVNELKNAPKSKALIVSVHHPAYSLDVYHSGSKTIDQMLDDAFAKSGIIPDIVFTGHVHNYQRFTRNLKGYQTPYIVAGAGGYHNLHPMQKRSDGNNIQTPYTDPNHSNITLENYCSDHNGYMVLQVTPDSISGSYYIVPKQNESWSTKSQKIDSFC